MAMFSTVFIVDDDASVREALGALFRSVGLHVELFGSALEFLQGKVSKRSRLSHPRCPAARGGAGSTSRRSSRRRASTFRSSS